MSVSINLKTAVILSKFMHPKILPARAVFYSKLTLTYDEWGSTKWNSTYSNRIIISTIIIIIIMEERVY